MGEMFTLASAANTTNPALFVLREKGYALEVINVNNEYCLYIASAQCRRFVGNSGPELLGLVALWEHFGDGWREKAQAIPDILSEVIVEKTEDDEGGLSACGV